MNDFFRSFAIKSENQKPLVSALETAVDIIVKQGWFSRMDSGEITLEEALAECDAYFAKLKEDREHDSN